MFLLDTNVISALMQTPPEPNAAAWAAAQLLPDVFTTAVCQAEILAGLAIMPEGRRRRDLEAAARAMFLDVFDGHILPFDAAAASTYAEIVAARRRAGRPGTTLDLMIAAIARARGANVVTRNVADFTASGVPIINPWDITGIGQTG